MTWQHLVCFLAGFLALLSQHWWEQRRAKARAEDRDYIHFDYPVAITLISLVLPGVFGYLDPEIGYLWWSWATGALLVAIPTVLVRSLR